MGQHKVPGASEGKNYKERQSEVSRFATFHIDGAHRVGSTFTMVDGRKYEVVSGGSYRRFKNP